MVNGSLLNGPWHYNVTIQVSDQFGNVYTQVIEVIVNPPPTNASTTAAPSLTTIGATAVLTSAKPLTTTG